MCNRKVKKLIAILAALMLSVTALAGCSMTDAAYTGLLMEAASLESSKVEADLSIELNPFAMYGDEGEPIKIKMNIVGDIIQTADDLYMDCNIKYGVNDTKMPYNLNVLMSGDEIYMPVKDCIDIVLLSYKYQQGYSDKMCNALKAALEKELAENDYVKIAELADVSGQSSLMMNSTAALASNGNAEIQKIFIESFTKMFFNLNSGMTKIEGNGVSLEITPESGMAFLDNLTKYLKANKKTIYKETLKLLSDIENTYRDGDMMKEIYRTAKFELEDDEEGFYEGIDSMAESYEEMGSFEKDVILLALKGSYLKHTLSKSGDTYRETLDMNVNYEGKKIFSLKEQATTTKTSVTKKDINAKKPIDMEALIETVEKVEKKVNPAKGISVSWWSSSIGASADITRVEGERWDYFDMVIEDGSMYLPMRGICEWFGEEVVWDNAAKKAYVVRNGAQIEMSGKLEYKTTFIKIRDFEKLGYTVDYKYDRDYREHTVNIKKN